ncbi:MAG: hypothetical protein WD073_01585 [Xanthobacteraceae bacterium]
MLKTLPISFMKLRGIPMTVPFAHPYDARDTLAAMSLHYPGEIFNVEYIDDEEPGAVVTWIPGALASYFLGNLLTDAVTDPWGMSKDS